MRRARGTLARRRGRGWVLVGVVATIGQATPVAWARSAEGRPREMRLAVIADPGPPAADGSKPPAAWPWPAGVALPAGMVAPGERLALFAGAAERAARIDVWSTHQDGSPHWVRLVAALGTSESGALELRATRSAASAVDLRIEASGKRERLVGGEESASFAVGRDLALRCGHGELRIDLAAMGLVEHGAPLASAVWSPPTRLGPDRGGVEWSWRGRVSDAARDAGSITVTLAVASDGALAELEIAFAAARDLILEEWRLPGQASGESLECSVAGAAVTRAKDGRRVALALREGDVGAPNGDSTRRRTEARTPPAGSWRLRAGSGRRTVELAWPDFAVALPAAATVAKQGQVALLLVARPLSLHAGQVVRRRLRLAAGRWVGTATTRPWLAVRDGANPLREPQRATLAAWAEFLANELAQPQRLDDRGCYGLPDGDFANGEYDLGGSLLEFGAHEREGRWLAVGAALARHTLDWDRTHEAVGTAPAGLFAQHGRDHASGRVEAGHQWIGGALGLARCEGELAPFEAARTTVAALAGWRTREPDRFAGPERRLAWPLHAALELAEATGAGAADAFARELVVAFAARQQADGFLDGDRRPSASGLQLWANSWVSLGISVTGLEWAARRGGDETARTTGARLGAAIMAAAQLAEGGLAEVVTIDPESGVATRRTQPVRGGEAALAAAGLESLIALHGDAARPEWAAAATALREAAWRELATPRRERTIDFAQALQALRHERRLARAERGGAQSLSDPSSLR